MKRTFKSAGMAALMVMAAHVGPALAEYPERPVTIILPWPPGDADDQLLRLITEEFAKQTGVPAKVVNRPGGYGIEGAAAFAASPADGYTVGALIIDPMTSYLQQDIVPYAADDMEVVGIFMNFPFILAARKDAPYSNLSELAEYAKTHDVGLAHFGFESIPAQQTFEAARQLGFEFTTETGYDITDCTTLANGDADVMNATVGWVLPCLADLKVIAAFTAEPIPLVPDAPLLSDQVEGPQITLWSGIFVPKGTPVEIKAKLAEIAEAAINSDRAKEISANTGTEVYWQGAEEAQARIDADFVAVKDLFAKIKR